MIIHLADEDVQQALKAYLTSTYKIDEDRVTDIKYTIKRNPMRIQAAMYIAGKNSPAPVVESTPESGSTVTAVESKGLFD